MKKILFKILRDFGYARGKILLMLLAACISGWGISSVIYSYMMSERDFEVNFGRTFPADIELAVENYSPGLKGEFLSDDRVVDVERREALGARIKDYRGNWMPLVLYAVDDIDNMRYDQFRILEKAAEQPRKILIETNAQFYLDPAKDSVQVQFPNKGEVTLKIGGTAHDARLAPARMEGAVFAYATSIDIIEPYLEAGRRRLLIKTNVSSDMVQLQALSEKLKAQAERAGSRVLYVNIPTPGEHIHQNIVDGISFLQKSGGVIISIMGIIMLSLILLTWVYPQVSQIGVMKAIGASTQQIFYSYTLTLLLLIIIGLLIGMPLGYITAVKYNSVVALLQNFEVVTDVLPLSVHALAVLVSISIPLLFGIYPLSKAAKTSVNEAMNKTFYTPHKGVFLFSQGLIGNSTIKYVVNNLFRNGHRTTLVVLLMTVGVSLYFTGSNLEYSIRTELERFEQTASYDLSMKLSSKMEKKDVAFLHDLWFVEKISFAREKPVTFRPPGLAYNETKSMRILSTDHAISKDFVVKGAVDKNCKECLYISGIEMKEYFAEIELGTWITITDEQSAETNTYVYSGIFKNMAAIGSAFFLIDDEQTLQFNSIDLQIKPGYSDTNAANAVDDALLDHGIDVRDILSVSKRLASLLGHFQPTFLIIKAIGIFTMLLGFSGLLIVLNLTMQERTREIGIMKSIGCSFNKISGLFRIEFLLINVFATMLGILVAMPLTSALCDVISNTVIYQTIPAQNNLKVIGATTLVILILQVMLISIYNQFKANKNARELLEHNF